MRGRDTEVRLGFGFRPSALAFGSRSTSTGRAGWSPAMSRTSDTMLDPPPEIRMATRFTEAGPDRSRLRPQRPCRSPGSDGHPLETTAETAGMNVLFRHNGNHADAPN